MSFITKCWERKKQVSNKKIFGVISVVDVLIIFSILFAGFYVYEKIINKGQYLNSTQTVVIKFYAESAPKFSAEVVNVGDRLEDDSKTIYLGQITDVKLDDGFVFPKDIMIGNDDYYTKYLRGDNFGMLNRNYRDDLKQIEITSEIKGFLHENGVLLEGGNYQVGQDTVVRAGKSKIFGVIKSIELKE